MEVVEQNGTAQVNPPSADQAGQSTARPRIRRSVLRADVQPYFESVLRCLPWPQTVGEVGVRTVGLTSLSKGEGTSTITSMLAATAAALGNYSVLVVDANLIRPAQHKILRVDRRPGLTDVLADGMSSESAMHASPRAEVYVMPAGRPEIGPAVFGTGHLAGLFKELRVDFDLVLVDLPPIGEYGAAIDMASQLDGVLLVTQSEQTSSAAVRRVRDMLARNQAPLLGAVLNKVRNIAPGWNE